MERKLVFGGSKFNQFVVAAVCCCTSKLIDNKTIWLAEKTFKNNKPQKKHNITYEKPFVIYVTNFVYFILAAIFFCIKTRKIVNKVNNYILFNWPYYYYKLLLGLNYFNNKDLNK